MKPLSDQAAKIAASDAAPERRLAAIGLLGMSGSRRALEVLGDLLDAQPAAIQLGVLQALSQVNDPGVGRLVVAHWKAMSPGVRREAAELLFSRRDRLESVAGGPGSERDGGGRDRPRAAHSIAQSQRPSASCAGEQDHRGSVARRKEPQGDARGIWESCHARRPARGAPPFISRCVRIATAYRAREWRSGPTWRPWPADPLLTCSCISSIPIARLRQTT